MASLADIVIDCRHPASLARFRASARDGDDPTVPVQADRRRRLEFQLVGELDIGADDPT